MTDPAHRVIPIMWADLAALVEALRKAREALDVLYDEANNFSVSDVYFSEPCMGHKGLGLSAAAIETIDAALAKVDAP